VGKKKTKVDSELKWQFMSGQTVAEIHWRKPEGEDGYYELLIKSGGKRKSIKLHALGWSTLKTAVAKK